MKTKKTIFTIILATFFVTMLLVPAMAAEEKGQDQTVSLIGEINYDGLLITDDGKQFELSGDVGDEVKQMSGERIQVMGTVMEEDGKQIIDVQDYQIKEKMPEETN